jgi:ATP-dependent DNA helicase RecG
MPPGRGAIKTGLYSHQQVDEVYEMVRKKVEEGRQAYVIYPIINESEANDRKAAKAMFKHFQTKEFKGLQVGLVHGQMKPKESQEIMDQFKNRKIDILVATTVVEVGVDVPNASVMVIEHAENFGLAQLHQLRGRIGRGAADSTCYLIADADSSESSDRLKAILSTTDGFKIAQYDLEIRGPGRFFGRHQHGLNELKVANPLTQIDILELARKEAIALIEDDPKLSKEPNQNIKAIIRKRYPTYLRDVKAG